MDKNTKANSQAADAPAAAASAPDATVMHNVSLELKSPPKKEFGWKDGLLLGGIGLGIYAGKKALDLGFAAAGSAVLPSGAAGEHA